MKSILWMFKKITLKRVQICQSEILTFEKSQNEDAETKDRSRDWIFLLVISFYSLFFSKGSIGVRVYAMEEEGSPKFTDLHQTRPLNPIPYKIHPNHKTVNIRHRDSIQLMNDLYRGNSQDDQQRQQFETRMYSPKITPGYKDQNGKSLLFFAIQGGFVRAAHVLLLDKGVKLTPAELSALSPEVLVSFLKWSLSEQVRLTQVHPNNKDERDIQKHQAFIDQIRSDSRMQSSEEIKKLIAETKTKIWEEKNPEASKWVNLFLTSSDSTLNTQILLERNYSLRNYKDKDWKSLLFIAINRGLTQTVHTLLFEHEVDFLTPPEISALSQEALGWFLKWNLNAQLQWTDPRSIRRHDDRRIKIHQEFIDEILNQRPSIHSGSEIQTLIADTKRQIRQKKDPLAFQLMEAFQTKTGAELKAMIHQEAYSSFFANSYHSKHCRDESGKSLLFYALQKKLTEVIPEVLPFTYHSRKESDYLSPDELSALDDESLTLFLRNYLFYLTSYEVDRSSNLLLLAQRYQAYIDRIQRETHNSRKPQITELITATQSFITKIQSKIAEKKKAEEEKAAKVETETRLEILRQLQFKDDREMEKPLKLKIIYENKTNCSICLEELNVLEKTSLAVLPCGHVFHAQCCKQLKTKSCPLCRTSFREVREFDFPIQPDLEPVVQPHEIPPCTTSLPVVPPPLPPVLLQGQGVSRGNPLPPSPQRQQPGSR